ncbi:hypothetical protein PAXINDRAFT_44106, partial [Paxillus involutus ATCC 200175]
VTIWKAKTHRKVVELEGHSAQVQSLAFSPDSARVVSGSWDGMVLVWSTTGERLIGPLQQFQRGYATIFSASVIFSPNGDEIAACSGRNIPIWNSHSGELVITVINAEATSLAWAPGQLLVVGCADGSMKYFDSQTGSLLAEWTAHEDLVKSVAISPNGNFIVSGSRDYKVRIWDMATSTQIGSTLQHNDWVNSVAISPDGSYLATGGVEKKVYIWSL